MTSWNDPATRTLWLLRYAGVLAIFVTLFGGHFSFDRFFDESSSSQWLQLRLWAAAAAGLIAVILTRYHPRSAVTPMAANTRLFLLLLVMLYGYYTVHLLIFGRQDVIGRNLIEILSFVMSAALMLVFFRDRNDWLAFCWVAELVGMVLFGAALAGFGNPGLNGVGWAPFGGPITFYRLEFFGFCAALFLMSESKDIKQFWLHWVISACTLFAVFASLSKSAGAAALLVVVYLVYGYCLTNSFRQARNLVLLLVGVLAAFSYFKGTQLTARVDRVIGSDSREILPTSGPSSHRLLDEKLRTAYRKDVAFQDLSPSQQRKVVALGEMGDGRFTDYRADLPNFLRSADQYIVVRDTTSRFRMAIEAIDLFKANPLLGAGIGYYTYTEIGSISVGGVDTYPYPHNILLEVLATMGVSGGVIFFLALVVSLYGLSAGERGQSSLMIFRGYLIFVLVTALFAGDYHDFRLYWLIGLAVVLSYGGSASSHDSVLKKSANDL
jgi:hypothetical protein